MSDDLTKRLRMRAVPIGTTDEAADEIERLKTALMWVTRARIDPNCNCCVTIYDHVWEALDE